MLRNQTPFLNLCIKLDTPFNTSASNLTVQFLKLPGKFHRSWYLTFFCWNHVTPKSHDDSPEPLIIALVCQRDQFSPRNHVPSGLKKVTRITFSSNIKIRNPIWVRGGEQGKQFPEKYQDQEKMAGHYATKSNHFDLPLRYGKNSTRRGTTVHDWNQSNSSTESRQTGSKFSSGVCFLGTGSVDYVKHPTSPERHRIPFFCKSISASVLLLLVRFFLHHQRTQRGSVVNFGLGEMVTFVVFVLLVYYITTTQRT